MRRGKIYFKDLNREENQTELKEWTEHQWTKRNATIGKALRRNHYSGQWSCQRGQRTFVDTGRE